MKVLALLIYVAFSLGSLAKSETENTIRVGFAGFPVSNLFYVGFDDYSEAVTSLVLEPLIRLNLDTLAAEPALANHFLQNPAHNRFEFELNPKARFSDGTFVTIDDVEYTWKILQSPPPQLLAYASQFRNLVRFERAGSKFVFHSNSPIPLGLVLFSKLYILPKKHFSSGSFPKDFTETFIGSGPYVFESVKWGHSITLKRNPQYWEQEKAKHRGRYLFDRIEFHTQTDPTLLAQMLLKHQIDYLYFLSAKSWATVTEHPLFKEGAIRKLEVKNKIPFGMAGIAWNLRKPLFQDRRVRKALALLFDRKRLIHNFFYDQYQLSSGIAYFGSEFHHPENHPLPFDPAQASKLLSEAGWTLNTKKFLEQKGQPFAFEILTGNPPAAKYLAFYQEDLRKVGIRASIRVVDWATYLKVRHSGTFDALDFSRNRDEMMTDLDLTWNSEGARDTQSGNVTGFSNPEVDIILKTLGTTLEPSKRVLLIQKIDKIISEEYPMAFSWEPRFQRIAFWNQYLFNGRGFYNYSRWNQLYHDWRWNPKKAG